MSQENKQTDPEWNLTRPTTADKQRIVEISNACYGEGADLLIPDDLPGARGSGLEIAIAYKPGEFQPAGYMLYQVSTVAATIIQLGVHPDCRRQGVGRVLANTAKGWVPASERGGRYRIARIYCDVQEDNLPGLLFLRAMEFRCEEIIRPTPAMAASGRELDIFRMVYELRSPPPKSAVRFASHPQPQQQEASI